MADWKVSSPPSPYRPGCVCPPARIRDRWAFMVFATAKIIPTMVSVVNSSSIQQTAIWDVIGAQHKNVVVVGVPPSYPPRRMNGVNVGCFMTPDTKTHDY